MKLRRLASILVISIGIGLTGSAQAGEFHVPVGLTYASGIYDAVDELDDLYTAAGFTFDDSAVIPVGLTVNPYYEIGKGLSIGADLGPASFIVVQEDTFGGGSSTSNTDISYIIPVGMHVRFNLFSDKTVSPYVRGGFKYPIVGGPNVASSEIGPFGAVGVEFWRTKAVGLGLEAGYDASRIKVQGPGSATKSVTFPGFNVSIHAVF